MGGLLHSYQRGGGGKCHISKDCARIEMEEDGGKDKGGGKGIEEDTERSSGLEQKMSCCAEVGEWQGRGDLQ